MYRSALYVPAKVFIVASDRHPDYTWRRAMQDLVHFRQNRIFAPTTKFERAEPLKRLSQPAPSLDLPHRHLAIIDTVSGEIGGIIHEDDLHLATPLPELSCSFYEPDDSRSVMVTADEQGQLQFQDGRPVPDPINFMKGKVRHADGFDMVADLSFAMQLSLCYQRTSRVGIFPSTHLFHLYALITPAAAAASTLSLPIQADITLLEQFREHGTEFMGSLLDDGPTTLAFLMAAARVEETMMASLSSPN